MPYPNTPTDRGSALLAVLWLSAALSAIAFSVANTVRAETERTSTFADGVRTYYLAAAGVERIRLYLGWGSEARNPDGSPKYYEPGMTRVVMNFPSGMADVEVIPESAKLSLNEANPEELFRLIVNVGAGPDRAREIAMAIADWRTPAPGNLSVFDQYYLSLNPSFRARHASLHEIEELLLVKGMTPELFYGTLARNEQGQLMPQPGLKDCLSPYAHAGAVDVNSAQPAVMAAIGVPPDVIAAIVQRRRVMRFRSAAELAPFLQFGGPVAQRLTIGGSTIFTFRSTGRLRLPDGRYSDMSRTVSAMLKFHPKPKNTPPVEVIRWYDY